MSRVAIIFFHKTTLRIYMCRVTINRPQMQLLPYYRMTWETTVHLSIPTFILENLKIDEVISLKNFILRKKRVNLFTRS